MPALSVAENYRIATFAAPLSRDGPGLLLRDILKAEDPQITAVQQVIVRIAPDVLVLTDFDYDLDGAALQAFSDSFDGRFPFQFTAQPNTGLATGLDMDMNGRLGEARDAQGYGRFAGDGGMAILSRHPILEANTELSRVLWRDVPDAVLPNDYYSAEVLETQRLSTTGHWIVPIDLPDGRVDLMAFSATPPVFDGPEDRNGLRNRDELRLWTAYLDGQFGPPPDFFVIAGNANLDPLRGDGLSGTMGAFLADPRLTDPLPGRPTADWDEVGPGDLRVSYVLPSANWRVVNAGVYWPTKDDGLLGGDGLAAGPHHLVWVDIAR